MTSVPSDLPRPGESILSLRAVCKKFGEVWAAHNITLDIPRGSIYGFLGPNGAGKTTTIRSILNIILPDTGEVLFGGRPLNPRLRDRIGYLPEERGLYRKMKVIEQLTYLAELKSVPRAEALKRATAWLERLDLLDWGQRKIDELSKGMQQKIQFAATFICEPELVILDEPFSGLDPLNIELLREVILAEKAKGTTIIFSTHMLAEAEKICDAICLIDSGEVILDGSLESVRQGFPLQAVQVAYHGGGEPPAALPGVVHSEFVDDAWRLTLAKGTDPQDLLGRLAEEGPISLFAANRPSLRDIFLTAVRRRRPGAAADAGRESAPGEPGVTAGGES